MSRGPRITGEAGFTLIELLVTMSIAIIVLFATLQGADFFASSSKAADQSSQAQDSGRTNVRQMVAFLRQGRVATGQTTPIPAQSTPSRSDLTVAAFVAAAGNPLPGEQPGWVRYCASPVGARYSLVVGVRVGDAYAAPGACSAGDTTGGWAHRTVIDRTLLSPERLFDLSSSTCAGAACLPSGAEVQAVGISLSVATSTSSNRVGTTIRNAVSFRNRSSS